jgi:hypothetical protein
MIDVVMGNCNYFVNLKWIFIVVDIIGVIWHYKPLKMIGYIYKHLFQATQHLLVDDALPTLQRAQM